MRQSDNIKVVFFGNSRYILPIIQTLKSIESRFSLIFVVTTEKEKTDPVSTFCINNKIDYLSVSNLSNSTLNSRLPTFNSQLAVLANFGLLIPKDILNIFPKGILNIHPSLLPKYRGSTPGQTAILNGDKITGVTIIKLDDEVDHGSIIAQKKEIILPNDTSDSLYERLFRIGARLLEQNINKYIKNEIKVSEQDHSKAIFTKKLNRGRGYVDIANPPSSETLDRMTRAYYPWPAVWFKTKLNGKEKIIKLLPGKRIQVEGKNIMRLSDFVNGYSQGQRILERLSLFPSS